MSKIKSKKERIEHEEKYIQFLTKALASENFYKQEPEKYKSYEEKLKKAKFLLKTLKM